jgi:predicted nuclease of restriction endonuclease-like (RecB) superfamily
MTDIIDTRDYARFLKEIKYRIQSARIKAVRAVNRELIGLYWEIGHMIVERQEQLGWGKSVVDRLAADLLKEFPAMKGFSPSNLWRMRQFYATLSAPEFLAQAVREIKRNPFLRQIVAELPSSGEKKKRRQSIAKSMQNRVERADSNILAQAVRELATTVPWEHHVVMLPQMKDPGEHLYYLHATTQFGWTRKVLLNQIKAGAYERSLAEGKTHNFPAALPEHLAEQAEEALKSSYNLEFLGISREIKERELEDRLIEQLQAFILELGYGFCFVGRQYRLTLGQKEYYIDLLFYHRFLKSLVAVELKVGPFKPEYAGKMNFYLNLLDDSIKEENENPSIGIILCAERDRLVVEYSLKDLNRPVGVAEYRLTRTLPKELKGHLPSAEAFRIVLQNKE